MSRHRNESTGVIVSVDDSKDNRFGAGWVRLDADELKKPAAKSPAKKSN